MPVCFWQNMPSHIQAPTLREFAEIWPAKTHAVWCADTSDGRDNLGWQRPDLGNVVETTLPSRDYLPVVEQVLANNSGGIHVLSGMDSYPQITAAFATAKQVGVTRLALMVESGITMGLRGRLRPWRAQWIASHYIPRIQLVLAMGNTGVQFYRRAGFADDTVMPFLYQSSVNFEPCHTAFHNPLRLIYIGKFIRRKGVDVLLRALSMVDSRTWTLTIVGDGSEASEMQRLARNVGIAERIDWRGVLPSDNVSGILRDHDLCIVPSRFEGWGVVTNEAICAGVPVICSDQVTSRELVESSGAGAIFASGDAKSLARTLEDYLNSPSTIVVAKQRAVDFRDRLHPRRIAEYLAEVLQHRFCGVSQRPLAPWLETC